MCRPRGLPTGTRLLAALLVMAVLGAACTGGPADPADLPIRVGAGSTTEQQVLAALAAELLRRGGRPAEVVAELGDTAAVRDAALDGRIDVHWDYSGAAWALALQLTAPPVDAQESFEAVAAEEAENGLQWLGPPAADARLAFFVPEGASGDAEPTLSWLARSVGADGGVLCADEAFLDAPAGLPYLTDVYSIAGDVLETTAADETEALEMTAAGECRAGLASATSGEAAALGLVPLRDDQGVFPALAVAPVVRTGGRADAPRPIRSLGALADALRTDRLAALNARALAGEPIDELATRFLDELGLGTDG